MMGRFHFDLGGVEAGPSNSEMQIAPEWRGARRLQVRSRSCRHAGVILSPMDLTDPQQALRLKAYVWPDATERMVANGCRHRHGR